MRKIVTLLLLFFLFSNDSWATVQIPDIIIYNGDTLALFDCPLYSFPNRDIINPKKLFGSKGCFFTACWRNYVATWKIINNELILTKIRNACYPTRMEGVAASFKDVEKDSIGKEFSDLNELFPDRCHDGKVKADWVNATIYAPFGKLLHYVHDGFESTYEFEFKFIIKSGNIVNVEKLDNRKAKQTVFTSKKDTLAEFLKSKIDWSKLPKLPNDSVVKVAVNFSANENGVIDLVKLVDPTIKNSFTEEAIRVVRTIPEWEVNFHHGQHTKAIVNCLVEFIQPIENAEMKQLIAHDKDISNYSDNQKIQIIKQREKINDSIKVCYFSEYRNKNSRDYKYSYIFVDYTPNNKYIKNVFLDKINSINDNVTRDAQKRKLIRHNSNISKLLANEWYPLSYYDGKFYNYKNGSRFCCSITDSIINNPGRYFDTYVIQDFKIKNKDHYTFKLIRFDNKETLDLYFIDKKHQWALIKFRNKFQLFALQNEIKKIPIITYNYAEWVDLRDEFDTIQLGYEKLPKNVDSAIAVIQSSLNLKKRSNRLFTF